MSESLPALRVCRKLNNLEDAATDAEIAQEIDPSNVKAQRLGVFLVSFRTNVVKAYYNRALALQLLDKHDEDILPASLSGLPCLSTRFRPVLDRP